MSGCAQSGDRAVEHSVVAAAQCDEQAIVAVHGRLAERLGADGDDALAFLACALGDELLGPQREGGDAA